MVRSNLARSISDVGWASFFHSLSGKAESAGWKVSLVPPQYTSQRCSKCGYTCRENRNNEMFRCVSCEHEDHADWNAAKNILARGLPSGENGGTYAVA